MKKYILLALLIVAILVSVFYVIYFNNTNKSNNQTKINREYIVNEKRQFKEFIIVDSILLLDEPGKFLKIEDNYLLFYRIQTGGWYIWDLNNKSVVSKINDGFVQDLSVISQSEIITSTKIQNNNEKKRYSIQKWNILDKEKLIKISSQVLEIEDNAIVKLIPFTSKYYYFSKKDNEFGIIINDIDHDNEQFIALSKIFHSHINFEEIKDFENVVFNGFFVSNVNKDYIYKSDISSWGVLFDSTLKNAEIIKTIEDFPFPDIKMEDMGDGMSMIRINDDNYFIMTLRLIGEYFYTIEANMIEGKHLINVYDTHFKYLYSYDITKYHMYPSVIMIVESNNTSFLFLLSAKNNKIYKLLINEKGI